PAAGAVGLAAGTVLTTIGIGTTREGGRVADQLKEVQVPVVAQSSCSAVYGGAVTANMFCAGQEGKDACQGDSGGFIGTRDGGGNWVQAGIVSWGNGCARSGFPGVYTRLANLAAWAEATVAAWDAPDLPTVHPPIVAGKAQVPVQVTDPSTGAPIRFAASGTWTLHDKDVLLSGNADAATPLASGRFKTNATGAATLPIPARPAEAIYGLRVTLRAQGEMREAHFDTLVDVGTPRATILEGFLLGSDVLAAGKGRVCATLATAHYPAAGESVAFTIGALRPVAARTDAQGTACATIPGIVPGLHAVHIAYAGNARSRLLPSTFDGLAEARGPYQGFNPGEDTGFFIDAISFRSSVPQVRLELVDPETGVPLAAGTIRWEVGSRNGTAAVRAGFAQVSLQGVPLGHPVNQLHVVLRQDARLFIASDIDLGSQEFSTAPVVPEAFAVLQDGPAGKGGLALTGTFSAGGAMLPGLPFTAVVVGHGADPTDPATPVLAKAIGATTKEGGFNVRLTAPRGDGAHLDLYLLTKAPTGSNLVPTAAIPAGLPCAVPAVLAGTCAASGWEDFAWAPRPALVTFLPSGGVVDAAGRASATLRALDPATLAPVAGAQFAWNVTPSDPGLPAEGAGRTGRDGTATIALGVRPAGSYALSVAFPLQANLLLAETRLGATLRIAPFTPGLAFALPG
ncbi:MAG TPA: trypsin-like serine protease, partial [Candidatus Thermoplasmatota archaeon]|nr:trypsin-like serine protease [Candidatus Thermoplasmatota archaeon]